MASTDIFSSLGQSLDNATTSFVSDKAGAVAGAIAPIALAGVTLYIVIYGYMVMTGRVQEFFYDFLIKCVKIILIVTFSVNAGGYLGQVVPAIEGLQGSMVSAVGESGNIYNSLDTNVEKGFDILNAIEKKSASLGWREIGAKIGYWILFAVVAVAFGMILIAIAATLMIASVFLKILLALGPFFIAALLFPPTARFFDNWIGAVMTFVFVYVIGSAFGTIAIKIFADQAGVINIDSATDSPWSSALGVLIISIILFIATRNITSIAASLGGGVASEAVGAGQVMAAGQNAAWQGKRVIKGGWRKGGQFASWGWNKARGGSSNAIKDAGTKTVAVTPGSPVYNNATRGR